VLDGDTLRLPDGRKLRLAAIDAPELGRPCAAQAAEFLAERLAGAGASSCRRPIRHATATAGCSPTSSPDGESVSAALVERGLAWVYDRPRRVARRAAGAGRRGARRRARAARTRRPVALRRDLGSLPPPRLPLGRARRRAPRSRGRPARLLREGYAPCRSCLPWPP
jgi:endonuclease YncB( thermonuclease family)